MYQRSLFLSYVPYSYLSTSRGAGNVNETNSKSYDSNVQIPIYLARGRKLVNVESVSKKHIQSIDTYLPREGPETINICHRDAVYMCIDTYLPREGPETYGDYLDICHIVQTPIYLARDRKLIKCKRFVTIINRFICIDTYLPREGPETRSQRQTFPVLQGIAPNLPREGPETRQAPCKLSHKQVQTPIHLARGRKLFANLNFLSVTHVQLPIYLARGRKQKSTVISIRPREIVQLPIHLERGRKQPVWFGCKGWIFCIDTYLPREGPETKIPIGLLVSKRLEVQIPIYLARGQFHKGKGFQK